MYVFEDPDMLRAAAPDTEAAIQTGPAAGLWTKARSSIRQDNGGSVIHDHAGSVWHRACEHTRIEARWFGVKADGIHDDAPALQLAIDSLSPTGGALLLPTGRMRCASTLRISRPYITIQGANSGLRSMLFEPGADFGQGSTLVFDRGVDGILIQGESEADGIQKPRLGGITLREIGIAGAAKDAGQTGLTVKPSEGRTWGASDALLLDRIQVINCTWAAHLRQSDAANLTQCWLSECANGLQLEGCVYTNVTGPCIADNDEIGVLVDGGHGNEIASGIFVRNKYGLIARKTQQLRVNGGVFSTDKWGGARDDQALIEVTEESQTLIHGASFAVTDHKMDTAIKSSEDSEVTHAACQINGELTHIINNSTA